MGQELHIPSEREQFIRKRIERRMEQGIWASLALSLYLRQIEPPESEPERRWKFWAAIDDFLENCKLQLSQAKDPHERLNMMHMAIERSIPPKVINAASCKKRCFACCQGYIRIGRLELQALGTPPAEGIPGYCIYLAKDGSCSVYDKRPAMCRLHLVAGDPIECEQTSLPSQRLGLFYPELILSAYTELENGGEEVVMPMRE